MSARLRNFPRSVLVNADDGLPVKSEQPLPTSEPESSRSILVRALDSVGSQALGLREILEGLAVVAVHARVLDREPDVAGRIFVQIPRFRAVHAVLRGDPRELIPDAITDAVVVGREPDPSLTVFQYVVHRIIAKAVRLRNVCA